MPVDVGGNGSDTASGGTSGTGGTGAGNTGTSSDCGPFTVCGGDPSGSWSVLHICEYSAVFGAYCPDLRRAETYTGVLDLQGGTWSASTCPIENNLCSCNTSGSTGLGSGRYQVLGNQIQVTDVDGRVETLDFCRNGAQLLLGVLTSQGYSRMDLHRR